MSLRRTRKVGKHLLPKTVDDFARVKRARRELTTLQGNGRYGTWANERMPIEMGISYYGPIDDRAWQTFVERITRRQARKGFISHEPSNPFKMKPATKMNRSVIMEQMGTLSDLGVISMPSSPMLREQVAEIMVGAHGQHALEQFNASVFCWLVNEKEYVGCDRDAWKRGFDLVHQVTTELGTKFSFTDLGYQITGSSDNVYLIAPRFHAPYYTVRRHYERHMIPVCIDPVGASNCMFADVLVTLLLSLATDKESAKRIDTLYSHVYGPRRRNGGRDANRLWHHVLRAQNQIGEAEENGDRNQQLHALQRRMRLAVDRFQTNLNHWNEFVEQPEQEEEEG